MALRRLKPKNNALPLIGGLFLALGAMYTLNNCSTKSASTTNDPQTVTDTIDVALEYAPRSFYRYADTLGGYNYDLLRLLARDHGLKFRFHPVASINEPLKQLDDHTFDLLIANIPSTAEMKENYTLLEPVMLDRQVLVQRRDSAGNVAVRSQLDLSGDTVWIVKGSSTESRINNLAKEIGAPIHIKYEEDYGNEQLVIMTALGDIDRAVVSERIARELADKYPNLDISTDISFNQFQSWIAAKESSVFADSIDAWIKAAKKTDDYRLLVEKYFSPEEAAVILSK